MMRCDPLGQAALRLDQQHDDVGICGPAPGGRDHRPVKPAARREQAGRVDEDDLGRTFHRDAANPGAGGLHLVRDDGDLGAHHPVQKRRFPGVRLADQRHETGARARLSFGHSDASIRASKAFAAACSACRLVPAEARSTSSLANRTATVNTG